MRLGFPKISNREWMFLGGGILLGYLVVPRILHHSVTQTTDPETIAIDPNLPPLFGCPVNRIVTAAAGNKFCCPFDPGPNGECSP